MKLEIRTARVWSFDLGRAFARAARPGPARAPPRRPTVTDKAAEDIPDPGDRGPHSGVAGNIAAAGNPTATGANGSNAQDSLGARASGRRSERLARRLRSHRLRQLGRGPRRDSRSAEPRSDSAPQAPYLHLSRFTGRRPPVTL